MERNCERHTFELAGGQCRLCAGAFCADCLIHPFGTDEPPFCKACALTAGGIRSTARNPRRATSETEAPKRHRRSGGLFARLRGSRSDDEPEDEPSAEERLEREVAEARQLLDAQRLPGEPDEEPEPLPTPNIAPPGGPDEEPELTHRTVPDVVAGGLDVGDGSGSDGSLPVATTPPGDDTVPDWARPEAAGVPEAPDPTPEPDPAELDLATPPAPDPTPEPDPAELDLATPPEPTITPAAAATELSSPNRDEGPPREDEPRIVQPVGADVASPPVADPSATTADGRPLFAPASTPATGGRAAPDGTGSGGTTLADAPREDLPRETAELLRRIADLRRR